MAGPELISFNEIIDTISKTLSKKVYKLHIPNVFINLINKNLLQDKICDITEVKKDFTFNPISFEEGKIFLGTEKWDGAEFSIIDINNPASPSIIGSFETGSKVNDIYINDKYAYIADSDITQFHILDLNNILNPNI